jgi:diguanylate cyclase (GGDEF)-like protein
MNPPFPPQPNMFSMTTITMMIMITFLMQGSLIAISARLIKAYRGVREASIATFALSFGFLVLLLVDSPNVVTGYVSNLLIACAYFLIYLAICRFTERPYNRILVFGFLPIGLLAMALSAILNLRWFPLITATLMIGFVFLFASALMLLPGDHRGYKLAATLMALPLLIYALVMLARLVAGLISRVELLPVPTLSGTISVMALFILSYLWTAGFILMISQRLQNDLTDLAMNDALTRIRNRRAMQGMLDFEMRQVDKEVREFSIILLDIDHFKKVNDTYGHDIGDQVLQWLAATLQHAMRIQDVVARWGGEEFLILLPDTLLEEAVKIAERLRSTVDSSRFEFPSGTLHITFSAGVSSSTTSRNVNQLCKIADQALYIAKQTRNQVVSQEAIPAVE